MSMRGIRGATCLTADDATQMHEAVRELLTTIIERNHLSMDDIISVLFTATQDLRSSFPAVGARELGMVDIPLICAQEIPVDGALPRTVRVLMHVESDVPRSEVQHVYLRGAEVLRKDLVK